MYPDGICAPGYLFDRILAVPASSAPVERVFSNSELIVHPHRAEMSDKLLESLPSVLSSADCCELVMGNVRGVANFVIIVIFFRCLLFGILLCQLSLTAITYPFRLFIN